MNLHLETDRLILRDLEPSDAQGIFTLDSDLLVHRYLGQQPINTLQQAHEVIRFVRNQYTQHGIGRWAVVEKQSGQFIGWAGFKRVTELTNGHCDYPDLGYRFIREHWGRGYATEAAKALLAHGFTNLAYKKVYAMADVQNLASCRVLEKVGMQRLETFLYDAEPHHWFEISKPRC